MPNVRQGTPPTPREANRYTFPLALRYMGSGPHWPLLTGKGQAKYAIVAVDYFTKWAEAKPLTSITERKTTEFIWKNLICRFGIPYAIVSDNDKQFDMKNFEVFVRSLG